MLHDVVNHVSDAGAANWLGSRISLLHYVYRCAQAPLRIVPKDGSQLVVPEVFQHLVRVQSLQRATANTTRR